MLSQGYGEMLNLVSGDFAVSLNFASMNKRFRAGCVQGLADTPEVKVRLVAAAAVVVCLWRLR